MDDYDDKLDEFILLDELWPDFKNRTHIIELNKVSQTVFCKGTMEGYLSSILINQQIAEEMIWVLLKDCQAMIKISLKPHAQIDFGEQSGVMFGRLIDELKKTLDFEQKSKFIEECNALNKIRISVVHGLSKTTPLSELGELATQAKKKFESLSKLYFEAHTRFCDFFEQERETILDDFRLNELEAYFDEYEDSQ